MQYEASSDKESVLLHENTVLYPYFIPFFDIEELKITLEFVDVGVVGRIEVPVIEFEYEHFPSDRIPETTKSVYVDKTVKITSSFTVFPLTCAKRNV